jgi:uncharacterized protein (DUF1330 family)
MARGGGFMHGTGGAGLHAGAGMPTGSAARGGRGMRGGAMTGGEPGGREGGAMLTPAYVLISVSKINDADGLEKALSDLRPTLPGIGARLSADTDTPEAWVGSAPEHVMVVQFDSRDQAEGWKSSDSFKRFESEAQRTSVANIQLVQGLRSSGPGAARRAHHGFDQKAFEPIVKSQDDLLSKMKGICSGC